MRLDESACWALLSRARRAVLGTVHPDRGVDTVPVVLAVSSGVVMLPLDTVKDKQGRELQRVRNVARDPRCVVLADHYEEDWSRLWWVRLHGRAALAEPGSKQLERARTALAARYSDYDRPGAIDAVLVVRPDRIIGWSAGPV